MKAIIIDDECNCCKTLELLLHRHCSDVDVVATAANGMEGLEQIKLHSPDIVFLDVEMPKMSGFEMLEHLSAINFHLVFTTSYDQYALKAFRFSAVDYLLKPIDRLELQIAVDKIKQRSEKTISQQIALLLQKIQEPQPAIDKIALPTMEGLQLFPIDAILYCESNDNYCIVHLKGKKKFIASWTLKEMEEALLGHRFCRVHRCYLVNLNEVEKYTKGEGGYLTLSDGAVIDVSRSKKERLLAKLISSRR